MLPQCQTSPRLDRLRQPMMMMMMMIEDNDNLYKIILINQICTRGTKPRSSKTALFDRANTTLYSSSMVTMPLSITVSESPRYSRTMVENYYPLYLAPPPPFGMKPSDVSNDPWWRKTRMMGLSDSERILTMRSAVLIQYTRVTDAYRRTDRQTDGIGVAYAL